MRILLGAVLIGEVSFKISVSSVNSSQSRKFEQLPAKRYRQIFASYSHKDAGIVEAVTDYVSVTGDRYFIDALSLRSGERWQARLAELISLNRVCRGSPCSAPKLPWGPLTWFFGAAQATRRYSLITPPRTRRRWIGASSGMTVAES
jgi:hypothetical protein